MTCSLFENRQKKYNIACRKRYSKFATCWLNVLKGLKFIGVSLIFTLLVNFVILPADESAAAVDINLTGVVTETYTDNLFFSETNKESDFGTFLTPLITVSYISKDVILRGTYGGTAQFFYNNSNANFFAQNSNFFIDLPFLTKRFKGFEIQLIESFNFSPQLPAFSFAGNPTDDPTVGGAIPGGLGGAGTGGVGGVGGAGNVGGGGLGGGVGISNNNQGVFTQRANAFINTSGFRMTKQWSPTFNNTLSYINRYLTFEGGSGLQDSISHLITLNQGVRLTPSTQMNAAYGYNLTDFIGGNPVADQFQSHSITIGASHIFTPAFLMSVNGGTSLTANSNQDITKGRINPRASVVGTYTYPKGTTSVGFNQAIGPGGGVSNSAVVFQSVTATTNRILTRNLSGNVGLGFGRNITIESNEVDVLTYSAQAGLFYRILSWLSAVVSYSHITQASNGTFGVDASRNFVSVGLTGTSPTWRALQ